MRARGAILFLAAVGCSGSLPSPSDPLPPIPASVPGALGPIPIVWVDSLRDPDNSASVLWGAYSPSRGIIFLSRAIGKDRAFAWAVLHHELCHVVFQESGLRYITPPPLVQAICDAVAHRAVTLMRAGWPPADP